MKERTLNVMDIFNWEMSNLGAPVVYPGHPVVIACMTMDLFESLEEAAVKREDEKYPALLTSPVPGSGCAMWAAIDLLKGFKKNPDYSLKRAEEYWINWIEQSPNNMVKGEEGKKQAEKMLDTFKRKIETWPDTNEIAKARSGPKY